MPLARIDLIGGKSEAYRRTIGDVVYDAMLSTLGVPQDDRFQIVTEHPAENFIASQNYLGIRRSAECVIIQVTLSEGRAIEKKQAFYKAIADGLNKKLGMRREDVFINLIEVKKENWSFGNGLAQYA